MNDFLFFSLQVTVSGLVKVAVFTTNVDEENQCLIIHKCACLSEVKRSCVCGVITTNFLNPLLSAGVSA